MKTDKQLVLATLTDLQRQIISKQMKLKMTQMEWEETMDRLMSIEVDEETLKREIKALKDKATWEAKHGLKIGAIVVEDGGLDSPPEWENWEEGEEDE